MAKIKLQLPGVNAKSALQPPETSNLLVLILLGGRFDFFGQFPSRSLRMNFSTAAPRRAQRPFNLIIAYARPTSPTLQKTVGPPQLLGT